MSVFERVAIIVWGMLISLWHLWRADASWMDSPQALWAYAVFCMAGVGLAFVGWCSADMVRWLVARAADRKDD